MPPMLRTHLAAEFDRYGAKDQRKQQRHERCVESGKHGRVCDRESRKQRAAKSNEPDFVPVPDRTDGVDNVTPVEVRPAKQVKDAYAQIETIQNRIAGKQHTQKDEPYDMEVHGQDSFASDNEPSCSVRLAAVSKKSCAVVSR